MQGFAGGRGAAKGMRRDGDGPRHAPSGRWGVRGMIASKVLDAFWGGFTFRERAARGRRFTLPHFASGRRAALRARFEISAPEDARLGILVRLGRAENPVRQ